MWRQFLMLRSLTLAVAAIAIPLVLCAAFAALSRRLQRRTDPIDRLIRANAYRYRPGMSAQDQRLTNKAGEAVWQETLRAQRRGRKAVKPERARPRLVA